MARNKRCTEAELLDILMNSDEDEAFLVQEKEGDGWDVLPEDSVSEISFEEVFDNVSDNESIFKDLNDDIEDDVGAPPQKRLTLMIFLNGLRLIFIQLLIDVNEMYTFLGVCLLMPLMKKQRLQDYWTKEFIIETPIFSQNSLYPFQNLVIDESSMLFKGRISFRQYIPSKRHRFGIKCFVLVDCETGYILDYIMYTGSTTEIGEIDEKFGKSGSIALTLTEKYWGNGHRLYTDNWYTSSLLFQFLFENKMNCCGTVKANRKCMPPFDKKKAARGKIQHFSTDTLLAIKWTDKRDVLMLTSFHDTVMDGDKEKPVCVIDYNSNMGGVDRVDMLLSSIESVRKTMK
ncbi:hypothetical protein NQ318_013026 [Aromia moschata]|uniref:PiggyBac transposable element-derived protein domain-containing protein n=1 Tax=Aromia moschata TaxID=1265417 RepID=A0AAV8Y5X7_9CUCU|nr:hypothetical protein NQ318_013026 [Aromia moschata]